MYFLSNGAMIKVVYFCTMRLCSSLFRGALVGVLTGFAGTIGNSAHAGYFQGIGDLPGGLYRSFSRGISGDGLIITGNSVNQSGAQQAFRWNAQTGMVPLPSTPFGPFSSSQGISRDGTTIFASLVGTGNPSFRWSEASGFESLGAILSGYSPTSTNALLSTNGSVIVGGATLPNSPFGVSLQPGRWSNSSGVTGFGNYPDSLICCGVATAVSGDGSIVIGTVNDSPTYAHDRKQAFRWTESTGMTGLGWLPGADPLTGGSFAYGITEDGNVIVGVSASATGLQPFRWTQDTGMVSLGVNLVPGGISGDGSKIYGSGVSGPSIWDSVNGVRSAVEVFIASGLDFAGWTIGEIRGMSRDGMTLTGNGINPNGDSEAWVANLSASIPGSTAGNPLLPCTLDVGFAFCPFQVVDVGLTSPLFIDPVVAIGYDYAVTGGPLFASVLIPAALPGGDSLFELILPGFGAYSLMAGTTLNLLNINASGFSEFRIVGIDPSEMIDPADPTAFVTGVTFTASGTVSITQKPLTAPATVPGPLPIMGLAFGYRWSRLLRRRLQPQAWEGS